jgi:hypothetical protein
MKKRKKPSKKTPGKRDALKIPTKKRVAGY